MVFWVVVGFGVNATPVGPSRTVKIAKFVGSVVPIRSTPPDALAPPATAVAAASAATSRSDVRDACISSR